MKMRALLLAPFSLLTSIVGKFSWSPPAWLPRLIAILKKNFKLTALVISCCVLSVVLLRYLDSLPKPIMVTAQIDTIHLTANYQGAKHSPLNIAFEYDLSTLNEDQLKPEGDPSVARLDLVGEEITTGITLSPAKKGKWVWLDDRRIEFMPETDWPAGVDYTVSFGRSVFSDDVNLSESSYAFSTQPLAINVYSSEFYQDPSDISSRQVIATIQFTHPIDQASLEKHLSVGMQAKASKEKAPTPHKYSVSYSNDFREAYVATAQVDLPSEPNYMKLLVKSGVKSILGGSASSDELNHKVLVPDVYGYLKVDSNSISIVRNASDQPEQVIMLEFTDYIDKAELLDKLAVYKLPTPSSVGRDSWTNESQVDDNVLSQSAKVQLQLIPNERAASKLYSFVIDEPESTLLYLRINNKLTSVNKFVHASRFDTFLYTPEYPKEVKLGGDGSVLSDSGNHKLSVVTRGVSSLKYTVGKLLKGKINHLISQTEGDITNPRFNNWSFGEQDVVEYESAVVNLQQTHPKQANHSSYDLSQYLPEDESRFGLFFVDVSGWDKKRKQTIYGVSDKRLILVTDLGVIVKNNADKSHDVFVQSIADGLPVAGASVELLGRNGVALLSAITDAQGHVSFASTDGYSNEKRPTVYVVKTNQDMSFIPYEKRSRQINLSKFDIGGVTPRSSSDSSLNAFLFSDRGIYRPGEVANVGIIVKNDDLSNVEGIPLEVVIRGPRNKEVEVERFNLPEKGFADIQYPTDATSDTGQYSVSLHLIQNGRYRGAQIGSASFKVEEFQPDTMRIQSKLENVSGVGWSTLKNLRSTVSLSNLFGSAAQDRKMVAKVSIEPSNFSFDAYQDYHFNTNNWDAEDKPLSLNETLDEKRSDSNGITHYDIDLEKFDGGTYFLRFFVEGFDQAGGRSVSASSSMLLSPFEYIVGYKPDGDLNFINANSERSVEFIGVNSALKRQSVDGLTLDLIEIQHVSTLVKQANGTYKYQTIRNEVVVSSTPLTISEHGYKYSIDTNAPGDFAVEVRNSKKQRLSRVGFSVAGFANLAGKLDKNAELQLKLDKQDYRIGDTIKMGIKAPYVGAGLITIETDKVHQFKWFKTDQQSSVQEIELNSEIDGNAYVNVAFVRDVGSQEIFTSPLSYAVKSFAVDRSKREVDIDLSVAPLVRPGKPMEIKFTTSKPSKIAVFAVDEGILQVAKYKSPEPLSHFLKKRALNVETMQILDLILPDFDLVKQLSASGGGSRAQRALAKNLNPFARKTDKPAVFWSGIYDANEIEQAIEFDVPNTFSGELRVMAVAVADEALGATSDSTIVRGPFVISPNVLNMAAPGDEFDVTVGVANIIEGSGKGALIELKASSTDHLEIISSSSSSLLIDEGSEAKFEFRVRAKGELGAAELRFTASYKGEELTRSAGLSVRPATVYQTDFTGGYIKSGKLDLSLDRSLYANLAKQSISASASPLLVVDGLSAYLDSYPHGCTEQIVSKVFPVVGLLAHPSYASHLPDVKVQFDYLIDKLRSRQLSDGGFSFWPGVQRSAEYPSIYVMHFLIEANELGYPVPSRMLERGKDYLRWYVQKSQSGLGAQRDRANAVYLLARMGVVASNYLVDLEEGLEKSKSDWRSDITSVYMAATYKLLQNDSKAAELIRGYKINGGGNEVLDDFHSSLAMDAQYIYLLSKHFSNRALDIDGKQILSLTDRIYKGEYNTIASAYSVLALGAYSSIVLADSDVESIEFSVSDSEQKKTILDAIAKPFLTSDYNVDSTSVSLTSDKPLFFLNVQSGFNNTLVTEPVKQGLEVVRDFVDEQGKIITSFEQGQEITVRLKIRSLDKDRLRNIAIIDLLPGGFEVVRNSIPRTAYDWAADYVDVREDRVVYYGSFSRRVTELSYKVKLTASGQFVVPSIYAESMYDRSIRAISKPSSFNVTAKP